jgi:hypothetical protein
MSREKLDLRLTVGGHEMPLGEIEVEMQPAWTGPIQFPFSEPVDLRERVAEALERAVARLRRTTVPVPSKDSVRVSGVWLVKTPSNLGNKIEVLVEVDGQWRRAISTIADDGPISHISEPAGMRTAPPAETTETPVRAALVNLAEEAP